MAKDILSNESSGRLTKRNEERGSFCRPRGSIWTQVMLMHDKWRLNVNWEAKVTQARITHPVVVSSGGTKFWILLLISWWKASRSMTRHETPEWSVDSSAITLAVRRAPEPSPILAPGDDGLEAAARAFSPKKSPLCSFLMSVSLPVSLFLVTRTSVTEWKKACEAADASEAMTVCITVWREMQGKNKCTCRGKYIFSSGDWDGEGTCLSTGSQVISACLGQVSGTGVDPCSPLVTVCWSKHSFQNGEHGLAKSA